MQGLAALAALLAIGYGFGVAGVLGALTGLVAVLGVGSGLAIATAESGTGVAASGGVRAAQRIGGFLAAGACLAGAVWGGWTVGWLWGLGGYIAGAVAGLAIGYARTHPVGGQHRQQPESDRQPCQHLRRHGPWPWRSLRCLRRCLRELLPY